MARENRYNIEPRTWTWPHCGFCITQVLLYQGNCTDSVGKYERIGLAILEARLYGELPAEHRHSAERG
jgi:hypothetical protein